MNKVVCTLIFTLFLFSQSNLGFKYSRFGNAEYNEVGVLFIDSVKNINSPYKNTFGKFASFEFDKHRKITGYSIGIFNSLVLGMYGFEFKLRHNTRSKSYTLSPKLSFFFFSLSANIPVYKVYTEYNIFEFGFGLVVPL